MNKDSKSYDVSLRIRSSTVPLKKILEDYNLETTEFSYGKGSIRAKKISKYSVWRKFSSLDENASLKDHFADVLTGLEKSLLFKSQKILSGYEAELEIAVYFDAAKIVVPSIRIPVEMQKWASDRNFEIEVTVHACNEG